MDDAINNIDTTSETPLYAKQMLERMKTGAGIRSDSELGRLLGVSQQAVYNARAGNKIPDSWVRRVAERCNLSADWLLFGMGSARRDEAAPGRHAGADCFHADVVYDIVETLEEILQTNGRTLLPSAKAGMICRLCANVMAEDSTRLSPARIFRLISEALASEAKPL